MPQSIKVILLIALALSNVSCSKRQQIVPPPSRNCDYVPEIVLQPCDSLTFDETLPVGQAMLNWALEYNQCKMKHEVLRACVEADKPKKK